MNCASASECLKRFGYFSSQGPRLQTTLACTWNIHPAKGVHFKVHYSTAFNTQFYLRSCQASYLWASSHHQWCAFMPVKERCTIIIWPPAKPPQRGWRQQKGISHYSPLERTYLDEHRDIYRHGEQETRHKWGFLGAGAVNHVWSDSIAVRRVWANYLSTVCRKECRIRLPRTARCLSAPSCNSKQGPPAPEPECLIGHGSNVWTLKPAWQAGASQRSRRRSSLPSLDRKIHCRFSIFHNGTSRKSILRPFPSHWSVKMCGWTFFFLLLLILRFHFLLLFVFFIKMSVQPSIQDLEPPSLFLFLF